MPDERELHERIRQLLTPHSVRTIVPAGEGSDHRAFDVDGAFVVRWRRASGDHVGQSIEREAALLSRIARISPIPVPEVVAVDPSVGLMVLCRLPGASLLDRPIAAPRVLAEPLAEFVAAIHGVAGETVEAIVRIEDEPLDDFLAEATAGMEVVAPILSPSQRRLAEAFLAGPVPPPADRRTLCHNDLGAEHILVSDDGSRLTGIIDWSDAALTDPARDAGRILRDLGGSVADVVLSRMGADEGLAGRAVFHARCALLEDLVYGVQRGRPEYVRHALARFDETFA